MRKKMWWSWAVTIPIILWILPGMIWGYAFLGHLGVEIAMAFSSINVVTNSRRLTRVDIRPGY